MRIKKGVIIVGSLVLLTLLGIYMGFALHYQNTMLPHTTFAGVSIGGMDVQTAKKTIKKTALDREYKLDDKGKVVAQFTGHVVGSAQDVGTDLAQLKSAQNPWSWPAAMVGGQADAAATNSSTSLKLNPKKINSFVTTTVNKLNANRSQTTNASIAKKDGQFVVTKEVYGNNLDTGKVEKLVKKMVATGQTTGNLQNTYVQPTVKANSEKLQKDLSTLKQLSTVKGHYSIGGDTVTIPESLYLL
ncbi:hypothetical protein [Schleiferilactobacillus perolens]|uniref:hypothetical protein n=1 Tax=Schleiferilactobacillus perolens TaxID=100468 RepID=UPI0039E82EB5